MGSRAENNAGKCMIWDFGKREDKDTGKVYTESHDVIILLCYWKEVECMLSMRAQLCGANHINHHLYCGVLHVARKRGNQLSLKHRKASILSIHYQRDPPFRRG